MQQELKQHLLPLLIFFVLCSVFWLGRGVPYYNFFLLFFGLSLGAFFLDTDHLIYWFVTHSYLEESKIAMLAAKKGDYLSMLKILQAQHKTHTSLIFHHVIFHLVLLAVSAFVFTSTGSIFTKAFLLAINWHLFMDIYYDYSHDKAHLQTWLFARLKQQLPQAYLKHYVYLNFACLLLFSYLTIL